MKKIYLLLFICSTLYTVSAQDLSSTITQVQVTDVVADGWGATLNDDTNLYQKSFEEFTKQQFGVKSKNEGKTGEVVRKIEIPQISNKRGDLRLAFYTEGSDTKLAVVFLLGYDIWINPEEYPEGMEQLRQLTGEYLKYHYLEYYNNLVQEDEKSINKHRREIDKSENTIASLRKQIKKNEERLSGELPENRRASLTRKNQQSNIDINKNSEEIPDLQQKIAALDEHVLQLKETLKQVDAEYKHDYHMITPVPNNTEQLVLEGVEGVDQAAPAKGSKENPIKEEF